MSAHRKSQAWDVLPAPRQWQPASFTCFPNKQTSPAVGFRIPQINRKRLHTLSSEHQFCWIARSKIDQAKSNYGNSQHHRNKTKQSFQEIPLHRVPYLFCNKQKTTKASSLLLQGRKAFVAMFLQNNSPLKKKFLLLSNPPAISQKKSGKVACRMKGKETIGLKDRRD